MPHNYLKPHHVGISVANLTESIAWYGQHLDFELQWQKDFPEIKTQIAFLKHGDFQIELFEHYQTQAIEPSRKHPLTDMQFQGTKHICFVVENGLEKLFEKFKNEEVDIVMGPMLSPPKDAMMGFVRDNTGNLIEIIEIIISRGLQVSTLK
jgi:methylmalonyl-CoA/ethylmalonyl-CoA epimerase